MSMSQAVGLVASAVFLARLLPQPIRLARTGVVAGVSPSAAMNSVVAAAAWTAYGLTTRDVIVTVVSMLAIVPSLWTTILLLRSASRLDWVGGSTWLGIVVVAGVLGQLGLVLTASVVLTVGPQTVLAIRGHDLRGIAPGTMWLSLLDATTWGTYGVVVGDAALQRYGLVLCTCAVIILVRIAQTSSAAAGSATDPVLQPATSAGRA